MSLATVLGLTGSALLLATAVMAVMRADRYSTPARSSMFVVPFIVAWVPLQGLPIAGYLRGAIGDLSLTTWILLTAFIVSKLTSRERFRPKSVHLLLFLVLVSGLVLYPSALGLTYLDTYALGYGSRSLLTVFLALSLIAWIREYYLVTIGLTASVVAYSAGIFESRNLWDYWVDPLVTVYALYRLLATSWSLLRRRNLRREGSPHATRFQD